MTEVANAVEHETVADAIKATTPAYPHVVQKKIDEKFVVCRDGGPYPTGALVYMKPAPVDPTKAEYQTMGAAIDAATQEYPTVIRKANGKFAVCADEEPAEGAIVFSLSTGKASKKTPKPI